MQKSLWDEAKHPRAADGEFTSGSGGGGAATAEKLVKSQQLSPSLDKSRESGGQKSLTSLFDDAFEAAAPAPRKPAAPSVGVPGQNKSLFGDEPGEQKSLFNTLPPPRNGKSKKPAAPASPAAEKSLVERIEEELRRQSQMNQPLTGQREMFSRRFNVVFSQARYSKEQGKWITIGGGPGPDGKRHAGGTPVKVDGSGKILAGPDSIEGQDVDSIDSDKPSESPDAQADQHTPRDPYADLDAIFFTGDADPNKRSLEETGDLLRDREGRIIPTIPDDMHFDPAEDSIDEAPPPVAKRLPKAVEDLTPLHDAGDGRLVGATQLHYSKLKVDPKRFQYKISGIGEDGVTKELKGAKKYNPMLGGQLLVWRDPKDNQTYVVNGHHRFELANRSGEHEKWNGYMPVFYVDAETPEEARALGAVTNIAEGRGTAVDGAKYLRDSGDSIDRMAEEHGVSPSGTLVRDANILSGLSGDLFQQVAQENLPVSRGLAIARHLHGNHDLQNQLARMISAKEEKSGKDISDRTVEEMGKLMRSTPTKKEGGGGLFSDDEWERSLLPERASLIGAVKRALSNEKTTFKAVSSSRRVGKIQDAGNTLDVEGNRDRAKAAEQALEVFDQQAGLRGPMADAIDKAAERLANEPRKSKSIENDLVKLVQRILANTPGEPGSGEREAGGPEEDRP